MYIKCIRSSSWSQVLLDQRLVYNVTVFVHNLIIQFLIMPPSALQTNCYSYTFPVFLTELVSLVSANADNFIHIHKKLCSLFASRLSRFFI